MKEDDQVDVHHPPSSTPPLPKLPIESVIISSSNPTTPLSYLDPSLAIDPLSVITNDTQFAIATENNRSQSSSQFTDSIDYLHYHQSSPSFTTLNNIQHSNYLHSSNTLQHSQNLSLSSQSSNLAEIHEPSQLKQPLEYSLPSSKFTTIAEIHQPPSLKQSSQSQFSDLIPSPPIRPLPYQASHVPTYSNLYPYLIYRSIHSYIRHFYNLHILHHFKMKILRQLQHLKIVNFQKLWKINF